VAKQIKRSLKSSKQGKMGYQKMMGIKIKPTPTRACPISIKSPHGPSLREGPNKFLQEILQVNLQGYKPFKSSSQMVITGRKIHDLKISTNKSEGNKRMKVVK